MWLKKIAEDRHETYKKLRLAVLVPPGGDLEVTGVLKRAESLSETTLHQ